MDRAKVVQVTFPDTEQYVENGIHQHGVGGSKATHWLFANAALRAVNRV